MLKGKTDNGNIRIKIPRSLNESQTKKVCLKFAFAFWEGKTK